MVFCFCFGRAYTESTTVQSVTVTRTLNLDERLCREMANKVKVKTEANDRLVLSGYLYKGE